MRCATSISAPAVKPRGHKNFKTKVLGSCLPTSSRWRDHPPIDACPLITHLLCLLFPTFRACRFVENKYVEGWYDPRFPTLQVRGSQPSPCSTYLSLTSSIDCASFCSCSRPLHIVSYDSALPTNCCSLRVLLLFSRFSAGHAAPWPDGARPARIHTVPGRQPAHCRHGVGQVLVRSSVPKASFQLCDARLITLSYAATRGR